ncbi:MAG: FadR family transcriptional regulator [Clostridiales bacterium]|jgi:GntR family transcriptional repressor for pyruvate dehydrogenase complex|nr:FadR family transcriptional regulator [Clostridiales bacterium]OPZ70038.1 MAG: HTH-type transcriptional regulator LutR [Firmicutes bacterium ADurb.Bin467]
MTCDQSDTRNLYEQIADRLEREIISLYAVGQRLPSEQHLAERYQVSRTIMREALKLLKERGLVDSRAGSGAYITHPEAQNISDMLARIIKLDGISFHDIYDLRSVFEIAAIRRAVERVTEAELAEMEQLLEKLKDRSLETGARRDLDFEFHLAIARASRNPLLALMVGTMSNVFKEIITAGIFVKGGIDDGIKRHQRILDALKARSADRAAHMMYSHLYHSEMNMAAYLEEHAAPEPPDIHAGTLHEIKKEELP